MDGKSYEDLKKEFKNDSRIPCLFGERCYQKNSQHHSKYKHPPKRKTEGNSQNKNSEKRRKFEATKSPKKSPHKNIYNEKKIEGNSESENSVKRRKTEPMKLPKKSPQKNEFDEKNAEKDEKDNYEKSPENSSSKKENPENVEAETSKSPEKEVLKKSPKPPKVTEEKTDTRNIIFNLFSINMPEDFYKFYNFCQEISPNDPCSAFKKLNLRLVGPFEVLSKKIKNVNDEDKDKFLRHWRYFYDPPEFQTVIKGDEKSGLHFGYWRDEPFDIPVFVAKNSANVDCKIEAVGENLFSAMSQYIDEKLKKISPFEKAAVTNLQTKLKNVAKNNNFDLKQNTDNMKARERKVVARTLYKIGIVVPYNKKTQIGYRELSVTDNELKKIFKRIQDCESAEERKKPISELQEVIRLATIAGDESDFGTVLELAHDLWASGVEHVQIMAKIMFKSAYSFLDRPKFFEIVEAHLKDRKKGCDLSVL